MLPYLESNGFMKKVSCGAQKLRTLSCPMPGSPLLWSPSWCWTVSRIPFLSFHMEWFIFLLRLEVCLSWPFVIIAMDSAGNIVGRAFFCLSYSDGRVAGLTGWVRQTQGELHSWLMHGLVVLVSFPIMQQVGSQQWWWATQLGGCVNALRQWFLWLKGMQVCKGGLSSTVWVCRGYGGHWQAALAICFVGGHASIQALSRAVVECHCCSKLQWLPLAVARCATLGLDIHGVEGPLWAVFCRYLFGTETGLRKFG